MFVKKTKLVALPKPPTIEQLRQDIENCSNCDPFFGHFFENPSQSGNKLENSNISDDDVVDTDNHTMEVSHLNAVDAFEKVKLFVAKNDQMKDTVQFLPNVIDQLSNSISELTKRLDSNKRRPS